MWRAVLVLLALACTAPPAHANVGALSQLPGTLGCLASALDGCARARGLDKVSGLAVSPDGRHVYAVSSYTGNEHALTAFARDPLDGHLTPLAGPGGCVSQVKLAGCARGRGLQGALDVHVSHDGRTVYVAAPYLPQDGNRRGSIAVFSRDAATGAVTQLPGAQGCLAQHRGDGCTRVPALAGAGGVTSTADGRFVYAVASDANAIATFARDTATGALRAVGCVSDGGGRGCTRGRGLKDVVGLVLSPDGRHLYTAASLRSNAVAAFTRDAATGRLRQLSGKRGCVSTRGVGGCTRAKGGLRAAINVAISPDGASLYVTAFNSDTVTLLRRDAATGALTPDAPLGAGDATGLAVAPDGRTVYTTDTEAGGVRAFGRDGTTGRLRPLPDGDGCVAISDARCRPGRALGYAYGVVVAPDGRNVYVTGEDDDAIAVFTRSVDF